MIPFEQQEQEHDWTEIEHLLDIERDIEIRNILEAECERFRTELLKDEYRLPISLPEMTGMEY